MRRLTAALSMLASLSAAVTGCTAWQPARTYPPALLPAPAAAAPANATPAPADAAAVIRGQDPYQNRLALETPGSDSHLKQAMPVTQVQYTPPAAPNYPGGNVAPGYPGSAPPAYPGNVAPAYPGNVAPAYPGNVAPAYPGNVAPAYPGSVAPAYPGSVAPPPAAGQPGWNPQPALPPPPGAWAPQAAPAPQPLTGPDPLQPLPPLTQPYVDLDPTMSTPIDVYVAETQTGRFMFGAGINSDAGVTGQIVIDERNFDITAVPSSFRDFIDGTAFRGGGQGFRLEAMPGSQVQRYLVSFTEPYLLSTPISLNLSAFLFDRRYYDWDEQRLGGRVALGYRLTHDLSLSAALRAENVDIGDIRVPIPELVDVQGDNGLYSGRLTLTHDTRDVPFFPTEGHLLELSFEQVFGDFDYPRGELDFRKYFLVRERPDGSGRHTLGYSFQVGMSGSQTPIFENYFAGGYSTLRGFDFRGASPVKSTVRVGGEFRMLGSAEYTFPLTADDMLKGAFFVDFGTVEEKIEIQGENFRVAPGFGVRVNVPALGPAPLAFDFAFPVAKADTDDTRVFSFFFGMGR